MDSSSSSPKVASPSPDPAQPQFPEGAEADLPAAKQSQLISKVLSPAVRLWLRSQVERVEALQVKIEGGDRRILTGQIQRVGITAHKAIYQGLHLSHLQLVGENIRINLGQVLRGKPLNLLEPIPVTGSLVLEEADLNASLSAPLLANALAEFLATLLKSEIQAVLDAPLPGHQAINLQNSQIIIAAGQLTLSASLVAVSGAVTPIVIRTGLQLKNGHTLQLDRPQWLTHLQAKRGLPLGDLDGFEVDLGSEVDLQELSLENSTLICRGRIMVTPA